MGYSTRFTGELKFTDEATATQLAALKGMLGEDCREHPEWGATNLSYIDLELTDDFDGLKWDGAEKTYSLDALVNVVLDQMRKRWPEFGLVGQLAAQGEEVGDRWSLLVDAGGRARRVDIALTGQVVTCPHCDMKFVLEGAAGEKP